MASYKESGVDVEEGYRAVNKYTSVNLFSHFFVC